MRYSVTSATLLLLILLSGCSKLLPPSNVKITEVPAGGLTTSSFDLGYLQILIETTRQAAATRLDEAYERNKVPAAERTSQPLTEGRYEQIGGRRLAVVELSYSGNPMRVTRIVGIAGDRLITVSCISPRGEPVDPFAATGDCAEAVKEHLRL